MQTSMINVYCPGALASYGALGHVNALNQMGTDSPGVERGKGMTGRYTP